MSELKLAWDNEEEKESLEALWSELQKCNSWDDLKRVKTYHTKYLHHLKQCAIGPLENAMKDNLSRTRNTKNGYERARFIDRIISHLEQLAINKLNQ